MHERRAPSWCTRAKAQTRGLHFPAAPALQADPKQFFRPSRACLRGRFASFVVVVAADQSFFPDVSLLRSSPAFRVHLPSDPALFGLFFSPGSPAKHSAWATPPPGSGRLLPDLFKIS